MSSAAGGVNEALLSALPPVARVLELGCADGSLGERYKRSHTATWLGADLDEAALAVASTRLDRAARIDLDRDDLASLGGPFDLIVMGDVLEHLKRPEQLLRGLHALSDATTELAICMPNTSHTSVIERILHGDIMYDEHGLLDRTHLRMFGWRSFFKMLLDCGWLPWGAGGYSIPHENARYLDALMEAGAALGISREAAGVNINTYQLIVRARRSPLPAQTPKAPSVAVVVNVDNAGQADLNVRRSPGLAEIDAEMLYLRGSPSAADAFATAAARTQADWLLFCSQEVYLPSGSGAAIASELARFDPANAAPIGFAGVTFAASGPVRSGLIVDGLRLFDFSATDAAAAIADFAVLLPRKALPEIDPALGWNFWATDLCIRGARSGRFARVVRVPLFHNSSASIEPSPSMLASAEHLVAKHPDLPAISTPFWTIVAEGTRRLVPFGEA